MSILQKRYFTAEARSSPSKINCPTQTFASPHIEPRFVFGVLCALSVSAVRFGSEVISGTWWNNLCLPALSSAHLRFQR
jgi:hypothetical protein